MNAEALTGAICWLAKRKWGLSFLLSVASSCVLIFVAVHQPVLDYFIQGYVYKAGFHVGSFIYSDYGTRTLFGLAADFLVLMAFWFILICFAHRLTAGKQGVTLPDNNLPNS